MDNLIEAIQEVVRKEISNKFDILNNSIIQHDKKLDSLNNKIIENDKKLDSLNNIVIELNNRTSKIETEIQDFRESLFVLEYEHNKKLDAIYDLFDLEKEINQPKFDELKKISQKTDLNSLHILNHEDRICTLEKHNS